MTASAWRWMTAHWRRWTQWRQDNRREDRDPHHYTLEQFGFTRAGLERDFADYRSTFLA